MKHHRRRLHVATLCMLSVIACSTNTEKAAPPASLGTVIAPPLSATASPSGTSATTPDSSPFQLAATSRSSFFIFRLANATFVYSGAFLGQLEDGRIKSDPKLSAGLGITGEDWSLAFLDRIFGSWPDEAWALMRGSTGRVGFSVPFHWENDVWKRKGGVGIGIEVNAVFHDGKGWVGAWFDQMIGTHGLTGISNARSFAKPARATAADFKQCSYKTPPERHYLAATTIEVAGDGSVYAIGRWDECSPQYRKAKELRPNVRFLDTFVGADRWDPKTNRWAAFSLPDGDERDGIGYQSPHVATPKGIVVSYGKHLVRVEGEKVEEIAVPTQVALPLKSIALLSTGEFVAVDQSHSVVQFASDRLSKRMSLPTLGKARANAFRVWVLADDDVVAAGGDGKDETADGQNFALFRSKPMSPLTIEQEAARARALQREPPRAFNSGCKRPLALLYEVPQTTPSDFSFDATASAVSGDPSLQSYEFLDFKYGGKRYFGARLSLSSDKTDEYIEYEKRAKPLLSAIAKRVAGSHPKLVCHNPPPTRVLKFDSAAKKFLASL
jgi:hypothetical protein